MAPAARPPPPPLSLLLLLLLLLASATTRSAAQHDIAPEVTDIPDGDEFEAYAQSCMQEGNITEEEVHAAFEEDPNHAPQVLKCLWGCMYRKIGLIVDGLVSDELPPSILSERLKEYESLKETCGEKVAAAPDECEKGGALRDCVAEAATVAPA